MGVEPPQHSHSVALHLHVIQMAPCEGYEGDGHDEAGTDIGDGVLGDL
jgi:hypothetical protein